MPTLYSPFVIHVISLSLGEPDFNTPEFIKEAAKKAMDENSHAIAPSMIYAWACLQEGVGFANRLWRLCAVNRPIRRPRLIESNHGLRFAPVHL